MRAVWIYILVMFFLSINIGLACSCIPPKPAQEAMADASAVFSGNVTRVYERQFFASTAEESVEVTFDVYDVWKGNISGTATVLTASGSASCGFEFEEGKQYLVYAHGEDELKVSLCSRTALLSDAQEDITTLGSADEPEMRPDDPGLLRRIVMWIWAIFL